MNTALPATIAEFFRSTNSREFTNFLSLFTANAHVNDESNDYHGVQIKDWIIQATAKTMPTVRIDDITRDGDKVIVTTQLSGNFPGSPVELGYYFTLKDSKIDTLVIKP